MILWNGGGVVSGVSAINLRQQKTARRLFFVEGVLWKSLNQVRTSLIEMECPNFLKVVDLW